MATAEVILTLCIIMLRTLNLQWIDHVVAHQNREYRSNKKTTTKRKKDIRESIRASLTC